MQSNSDNPIERRSSKQQQSMGFPPPQRNEPLPCPRCDSTTTKFCYYNNYNLSQPRYFCKSCRRYWTHGGTLRNVPVGGGTRKISKKSRTASASASSSSSSSPFSVTPQSTPENPVFAVNNVKAPQMESKDMNQKENTPLLSLNLEGSLGISGYELTSGFDGLGFGLSSGFEGFPDLSASGGALVGPSSEYNAWHLGGGDGDCLGWSKLDDPGKNFE